MSTIYTGNPANITTPLVVSTFTGVTGAAVTPIVITTPTNHLYATGDSVTVSGVTGNTAANGTFSIIVLSPTTFSLTGTTGNGAYAGGGTSSDNSLTPQFTLPSDGDAFNASAFNVPYQAIADRTQFLATRIQQRADTPTSATGTWTCPGGVNSILVIAHGGGGGGGGGGGADATTPGSRTALGGGGGGGSQRYVTRVAVTPGTAYAYAIGVGGIAGGFGVGMGGLSASGGNDGGDTLFNAVIVGRGAGGGNAPVGPATSVTNSYSSVAGGKALRQGVLGQGISSNAPTFYYPNTAATPSAGDGGNGGSTTAMPPSRGGPSQGFDGGITGTQGASGGGSLGGGPGGGGGGGPAGAGGPGSTGGAGSATAGVQPTTASGPPATGSGAGGGGGAGGGSGGTTGASGCGGQSGGSGALLIVYSGAQATFT